MDNNRKLNIIKGSIGGLILLLGIGVLIGYKYGLFDNSFPWVIISIVCCVVVLLVSGIFFLPRSRIEKPSRTHEFRTDQHNKEYHKTLQKRENKDFTPASKYNQQSRDRTRFCDYCGIKLQKVTRICTNCGQKLD